MKKFIVLVVLMVVALIAIAAVPPPVTMRGDANTDGVVDIKDANAIATHITGGAQLSAQGYVNAASVTVDKISIFDALFIAQYVAGQRDADFNLIP